MKKLLAFVCVLSAVAGFAATVSIAIAPKAPAGATWDNETRAQYLRYFNARFYHAAKISGLKPFSETEKQHLDAAALRFADGSFQAFQKNGLLDTIEKIEKDPEIAKIMDNMLRSKDTEEFLIAKRELKSYLQEKYPETQKSEVSADLAGSSQQFLKDVEDLPSMPKLEEKSIYTFWNAVLLPGL